MSLLITLLDSCSLHLLAQTPLNQERSSCATATALNLNPVLPEERSLPRLPLEDLAPESCDHFSTFSCDAHCTLAFVACGRYYTACQTSTVRHCDDTAVCSLSQTQCSQQYCPGVGDWFTLRNNHQAEDQRPAIAFTAHQTRHDGREEGARIGAILRAV